MYVIKRDGSRVPVRYDSITDRNIEYGKDLQVDVTQLSQLVINSLKSGMTTSEIDDLSADTAFYQSCYEPDYDILATRIAISNLHKSTNPNFLETVKLLQSHVNPQSGRRVYTLSDEFVSYVEKHAESLQSALDFSRDYKYSFFGLKTLKKLYLLKKGDKIVERPQHMLMRVAIAIHMDLEQPKSIEDVLETYDALSQHLFTHASPTLFNAGNPTGNLSSCFLLDMSDDLDHIFSTNKRCAMISKLGGGIGINISKIRGKGSVIHSSNGRSDGIVPMVQCFNATSRYSNQCFRGDTLIVTNGGAKRIDEIRMGDLVCTYDGSYKKVCQVHENYHLEPTKLAVLSLTHYCGEQTHVTFQHHILVVQIPKGQSAEDVIDTIDPVYKTVEELMDDINEKEIETYTLFPVEESQAASSILTEEEVKRRCKIAKFVAILLGRSIPNDTKGVHRFKCMNAEEDAEVELLCKELGVKKCKRFKSGMWRMDGGELMTKFNVDCDARLLPSYLMTSTKEEVFSMVSVWFTDMVQFTQKIAYCQVINQGLAVQIQTLLIRFGLLSFVSRQAPDCYRIEMPDLPKDILYNETYTYVRLMCNNRKDNLESFDGITYDLSIEDNHNYVVQTLGIVHNSGRRSGSFAMYLEPSHPDVLDFLALRLPTPPDELRARDIFLAMWVSDLFMKRLEANAMWSLFCPSVVPRLYETYGDEYDRIYEQAERDKLYTKQIPAQDVWKAILQSQQETGMPYISYKDHINRKSMQSNLGLVRSSNLCNEIVEVTNPDSVAVCNLASVALHKFVKVGDVPSYDWEGLARVVKMAVRNLNKVIDRTHYPVEEARGNNLDYRPIGLGVQGLADTFAMWGVAWGSETSRVLNQVLFEAIYYYALEESHALAMRDGSYTGFEGSPISQGTLQYHMWGVTPITSGVSKDGMYPTLDWDGLRAKCRLGVRNSLLVALMPTASSSQILGSNECFEPFTSNMYSRSTNSGEFIVVNRYLVNDLRKLGLWTRDMVNAIIADNGSVQNIVGLPDELKERYKTVWEISQKVLIDMAADRGAFVDQTQSMNLFVERPTHGKLSSMHMYGWKKGLKTGSYYIRSKPARQAVKFTLSGANRGEKTQETSMFECVGCSS